MRPSSLLLLLPLLIVSCREEAQEAPRHDMPELPLSAWCAACHDQEYKAWQNSHHALAWRRPTPEQDALPLGQLTPQRPGEYLFREAGEETLHKVRAVIGHRPLVQYMVEGERGAYQCTAAAWDAERREWFDTVADDTRLQQEGSTKRRRGDWGHWLGRGMTWNSQCAACHVSGYEKNYDPATDSYSSRWQEPGVTCIQCHSLADSPTLPNGRPVRRNKDKVVTPRQMSDSCASCHARREELRPGFREGDLFEDYYRLELPLVEGVFWPNGMQRDECYTETGMRLSPMGRAGVTCLHCHDAHSARLRLPADDNTLCLSCHGQPGKQVGHTAVPQIDMSKHSPCPPGSMGYRCVECHMPESRYMARDARRDHAFTSPDPALSAELGHPNACTQCHQGKDNAWAAAAVALTYGETPQMARYRPRTRAVAAAMKGEGNTDALLAAYRAESNPTWRATLLELLARQAICADIEAEAQEASRAETPLLRAAAARILGPRAPQLLQDPVLLVRLAAAWAQLDSLVSAATPPPVLAELEASLRHQSDHPAGQMQLARLAEARARHARSQGDEASAQAHTAQAEGHYRRALALDPASAALRMDFAVALARQGHLLPALEQMLACTAAHPDNAEAQYRLGLLLHELGHPTPALRAFEKALHLAPAHLRAHQACEALRQAHPHPSTPSTPSTP